MIEIEILGPKIVQGRIERGVQFHEVTADGQGQSVNVMVWVTAADSYNALNAQALIESKALLERALAALNPP